jgi:hypothetical protein
MFDELRPAACAFEAHDRQPRDRRRNVGAQVAANHVKNTKSETSGSSRRCQNAAVST